MLSALRTLSRSSLTRSAVKSPHLTVFLSSSTSTQSRGIRHLWNTYASLLETHPISTKIVTGGTIAGLGDVGCQLFLESDDGHAKLDIKRTAIFTFLGGVVISPILHVWYRFLGSRLPGVSTAAITKRLALDQLGFAPTFLPIFLSSVLTLEGHAEDIPDKLRSDWWPITKTNWVVWVPAQLFNFRFVPGSLQVLFSNVMGLFWNAYLSYMSHSKVVKKLVEEKDMNEGENKSHLLPA
ncbi:peroxisomal membrane mpv17 pmp22-like protein [Plasmopara halstedii]|uniref:Peroxisomal membrane mpv17 pmp22-like protein n=1 Tax=Plasmopara halstedii TaxID=4781 RepID=A0A0P1ASJ6_PLAHL|nr:peroxisomal membrane mpv17 pmp22-like protein [Plasmopara halstedii]CEG43834.1 peroxisomal membrane mpv17 pmp22-like protein [Plasmopara halstedii]|eukprot:XP_024580203.1 peroxisomal membrane mpv17 pmp22-like protein [Plasmopara halstedii]